MPVNSRLAESLAGCLLGTAVGDALGLPYEALSKERQLRLRPKLDGHRYFFGRGMISDDTEHSCMVLQAVIVAGGDSERFARSLAWRLRFWLLGLPASIGLATLRALLKLWMGFPPHRSGVFSAGNGPAMRSAVLGVCYGHDLEKLRRFVRASTRLTHTDPKAEWGALAVALAAHVSESHASSESQASLAPRDFHQALVAYLGADAREFLDLSERLTSSVLAEESTEAFAAAIGQAHGVSGYTLHTVPVALHAWLSHYGDYRGAVVAAIRCGGDTDTIAAIAGGIAGAHCGPEGIPQEWRAGVWDWPRSMTWMTKLAGKAASAVASGQGERGLALFWPGLLVRNLFFLAVMLGHGFRRLLPPYA